MLTSLKPPYVQKGDRKGDLQVWIVDGTYIRGHINEEFTNFGQHHRYPFIPLNELWLDRGTRPDERHFFIDHLVVEHRLMGQGVPYEKALVKADQEERKERRRSGDLSRLTHHGQQLPKARDVHKQLWKKLEDGISIWIVDGRLVRSVFDIDFTAGGHSHVYEYIPQKEVWIDDATEEQERPYVLLHELHEHNLMAGGWTYNRAHADSSRIEHHSRRHPDEVHDLLEAEGWDR